MKRETEKLQRLLQLVVENPNSVGNVTDLVHVARSIAQAHFETHRYSIVRVSLQHGLTVADLAYDCVAEIFSRSTDGTFFRLVGFLGSLRAALVEIPATEVFIAFNAFVARVADAQLARLYAQADPTGARIHRNLRESLKQSDVLKLDKDRRGLVVRTACVDSLDESPPFPLDRLEQALYQSIDHRQTAPQVLGGLCDILCNQSEYRRSISLFDLVLVVKRIVGNTYEVAETDVDFPAADGLSEEDINRFRLEVEVALKEKILLTYLARGKVDRRQAEGMANALHDMLGDWCAGDSSRSLHQYICFYLPMNETEYELTLRTKMEYLMRLARDEFSARLVKEL